MSRESCRLGSSDIALNTEIKAGDRHQSLENLGPRSGVDPQRGALGSLSPYFSREQAWSRMRVKGIFIMANQGIQMLYPGRI